MQSNVVKLFWKINNCSKTAYQFPKRYSLVSLCRLINVKHYILFLLLSDIVEVPEIDMIFAISANAQLNELANFRQMKDIINAMIDKYGRGDIMYAVIVYGEEPSRLVRFTTNFDSDEALMDYISKMRKGRGASLTKALQLANEVHNVHHEPYTA